MVFVYVCERLLEKSYICIMAKIKMSESKFRDFKGFYLDKNVNKAFKKECIDLEVTQEGILQNLILRWLEMRSKKKKRKVEIYGTK